MYIILCVLVFVLAYVLNILTITVGYHRGLAHKALVLSPWLKRLVVRGGIWITGLDPKAWVVMHRMHHAFSDTPDDPHSPRNVGILGIASEQLRSYKRTIVGLAKGDPRFAQHAKDLDFPLHKLNFWGAGTVPYLAHGVVAIALAFTVGWLFGLAYWIGIMSHPVQGGLVNALGHAVGRRNFDTDDDSRNNTMVGWLVFGEGYQNNHHRFPNSASFSYRWHEVDLGYLACIALDRMGLAEIETNQLIVPFDALARSPR